MWVGVLTLIWAGVSAPAFAEGDHVLPPIFTNPAFGKLLRHDPYVAETASRIIGVQGADWFEPGICSTLLAGKRIAPAENYLELLARLRRPEMLDFANEWSLRLRAQIRLGQHPRETQIDLMTGSSRISFVHRRMDGADAPLQFQVQGRDLWRGEAQPVVLGNQEIDPLSPDPFRRKNTLRVETPEPETEEAVPISFLNFDGTVRGFGYVPSVDPNTFPSGDSPSAERDRALTGLQTITENFRQFVQADPQMNALTLPTFFTFFARTAEAVERLSELTDNFEQKPWIREFISELLRGTPEPADLRQHFPANQNVARQLLTEGVEVYIGLREKLAELQAN